MELKSLKDYKKYANIYSLENEIWKDITGFEGKYQVSNYGRVRSLDRYLNSNVEGRFQFKKGTVMLPNIVFGGYWQVSLYNNGVRNVKKFHRLVAEHFIENLENKKEVNHWDRNKENNNVNNLEWCTPKENMKHLEDNFNFDYGRKTIAMLDYKDNILNIFNSITEACDYLGMSRDSRGKAKSSNISICLKGDRKTAYGYKWKLFTKI